MRALEGAAVVAHTHYAFVPTYVGIEELKVPSSKEGQKQL
jgi:hypothetical protein